MSKKAILEILESAKYEEDPEKRKEQLNEVIDFIDANIGGRKKLSTVAEEEIREAYKKKKGGYRALAKKYDVSYTTIKNIVNR